MHEMPHLGIHIQRAGVSAKIKRFFRCKCILGFKKPISLFRQVTIFLNIFFCVINVLQSLINDIILIVCYVSFFSTISFLLTVLMCLRTYIEKFKIGPNLATRFHKMYSNKSGPFLSKLILLYLLKIIPIYSWTIYKLRQNRKKT